MQISKNFSIAIMNSEKITEVNKIIVKYSVSFSQSSAHVLFDIHSIDLDDTDPDITFFKMISETETDLNNKIKEMIEELNQIDTDYTLRNEDTGELLVYIKSVGILDIKFNKIDNIKEGTYKKIDELKKLKTEFGYCKGYKPLFRPIESKKLENIDVLPESIYMFCESRENLLKLNEYLSKKVMEIDHNFELELRIIK